MQVREFEGVQFVFDDEGFLYQKTDWSPAYAEAMARDSGVPLTPAHWQVIDFCRQDAKEHGGESPGLRRLSSLSGVSIKELYQLFPKGPGKLIARIAGLPKPKSCL